jgi:hypothetical protein
MWIAALIFLALKLFADLFLYFLSISVHICFSIKLISGS